MGVEKEGSKNGGYIGGFLHLFDWKAKSRKKLFSNKLDLPELSKQGKKSDGNFPMTRPYLIDEDEIGAGPSIKGSSDYSCASSVTDVDGFGGRAPGVVARLMGLDCLPTSNSSEPFSSPFFDTQSLCDDDARRRNLDYDLENQVMHNGNLPYRVDGPVMGPLESKPKKMLSRPIEKFQIETLPPKSAKTIPITHHKLLSPIRSPGFISTKNAAHIMEAAAKIIDPGRQCSTKAKMTLVGSSSVPLRVRDLKEKVEAGRKACQVGFSSVPSKVKAAYKTSKVTEASQRPVESNAAKVLKGQPMNKSWDGSLDSSSFGVSPDVSEGSSGARNKAKSVSLAVQAKVNIQKREILKPSSIRSSVSQKEKSEVKSSQPLKNQTNVQRNFRKKASTNNTVGALSQNNHKQNGQIGKEKVASKSFVSELHVRNVQAEDYSFSLRKNSSKFTGKSKIGSRKLHLEGADGVKELPDSSMKNFPRKKQTLDGNFNFEKKRSVDHSVIDKDWKTVQSNPLMDRHFSRAEDSQKKCMDVVSFTFTAPMAQSRDGSMTTSQVAHKTHGLSANYRDKRVLIDSDGKNFGHDLIGGDALSLLLEQKLRELTYVVESSIPDRAKSVVASNSASNLQDLEPSVSVDGTIPRFHDRSDQPTLQRERMCNKHDSAFPPMDPPMLELQQKFPEVTDTGNGNDIEASQLLDCRHPSPVSILEPPFSTESCNSSDTTDGNSMEGSSIQTQEVIELSFQKKFATSEATDVELLDSATSTSTRITPSKHATMSTVAYFTRSTNWELEYVRDILCNVESMFKDFALGRAHEIVNPHLFDQLESQIGELESVGGEPRLRRKVLFDCVSELMDLKCRQYLGGGCRTWMKGVATMRRKERLAEEMYKEITGWNGMGDRTADELIDSDMSSHFGKWLDFGEDAFVVGAEIEGQIFGSLVGEVIADVMQF